LDQKCQSLLKVDEFCHTKRFANTKKSKLSIYVWNKNLVQNSCAVLQHLTKNNSFAVTSMFDMFQLSILSQEQLFVLISLMTWL
jgi:hypothetical protein